MPDARRCPHPEPGIIGRLAASRAVGAGCCGGGAGVHLRNRGQLDARWLVEELSFFLNWAS
jgi:hypothetical protein